MSLPARLSFMLLACLLAGCGFHPLYSESAQRGSSAPLVAGIRIDPISNGTDGGRSGQQLKADLEDRLNPDGAVPANPAYRLNVELVISSTPIGVARDGTVSRYNVFLDSKYTLFRTSDGKQVATGNLRQVSSYNNSTNAYFSTYVSEQDSINRGVTELAELYRQRMVVLLTQMPETPVK